MGSWPGSRFGAVRELESGDALTDLVLASLTHGDAHLNNFLGAGVGDPMTDVDDFVLAPNEVATLLTDELSVCEINAEFAEGYASSWEDEDITATTGCRTCLS